MTVPDDPLEHLMAGMADGDEAFLHAFYLEYEATIRTVVRRMLENMGRRDLAASPDELAGLTWDACEVLFDRASGWRPGGAKPWNWARQAIFARVVKSIGHRVVEFKDLGNDVDLECEAGFLGAGGAEAVDLAGDDIAALAARHPGVALMDEAIRSVGCTDHQDIYWEYRVQQGIGDPSPSEMVGKRFGRKPATVRQIARRHGDRVAALIHTDPRFAALRDHHWWRADEEGEAA